jgi:putative ABC transport system substrate-binding protein
MGAKWLELLKQLAPGLTRVAVLRDASQGFAVSQFVAIQTVAPSLRVEVTPVNMRDPGEIEQSVDAFARVPNGGLIPIPSAAAVRHRDLILTLAARRKLPAVYWERLFVAAGGLIFYGPNLVDEFRQAFDFPPSVRPCSLSHTTRRASCLTLGVLSLVCIIGDNFGLVSI